MPMVYGYARVSSQGQSLDVQVAELNANAAEHIRQEKVSGSSMNNRTELALLLEFMRPGDTLLVTKIDRLARSVADLCDIVKILDQKGCFLRATSQPFETQTPVGRLLVQMLGAVGEFELSLRRERQMAGIAAAKVRGVYKGAPSTQFDYDRIRQIARDNPSFGPTKIARQIGCGRHTVIRALKERKPIPMPEHQEQ